MDLGRIENALNHLRRKSEDRTVLRDGAEAYVLRCVKGQVQGVKVRTSQLLREQSSDVLDQNAVWQVTGFKHIKALKNANAHNVYQALNSLPKPRPSAVDMAKLVL